MSEAIEFDLSGMKKEVLSELKAQMKAEAEAEAAKKAELKSFADEAIAAAKTEWENEQKAKEEARKKAPQYNRIVGRYSKNENNDEFAHWMATGDNGGYKLFAKSQEKVGGRVLDAIEIELPSRYDKSVKALQEGADTEGGYLQQDDFQATIVSLREQMSWVRQAGADIIQTGVDHVLIPTEATALANLTVTAEEGAYTTNDPLFGQVDIPIYKFTKLTKISEELLDDNQSGMEMWYARRLAEVAASTESYYVAVGSGSTQPQGVFVGGTAGLTFDSTGNIDAAEIPELFYKLQKQYRAESTWLMNGEVEGYLRGIRDANNWAFDPWGANMGVMGTQWMETLYGRPVFNDEGCATIATAAKVILIGNFRYYTLAERKTISIARNPYLYQANGQIGFFSNFRFGGAVTQAEAFQYGTMA